MFNDLNYLSPWQKTLTNVLFYAAVALIIFGLISVSSNLSLSLAFGCLMGVVGFFILENMNRKNNSATEFVVLAGKGRPVQDYNSALTLNLIFMALSLFVILQLNFQIIDYNMILKLLGIR